ncbi:CGNR zinc finger domain-containing protein [Streptomyces lydicamycinicus]|uniref:CGNR zinc finger domain-containing protein n=1 Tax=Streptomyces lydicamycinicus TaxID=1546107 RepID=UPI002034E604|nr:CGNR zinc finger domain-containing protein [Streptomyces lydicamycinicus]USA02892.1 CGNR zinc finger domain-containing protein [Streptomyces lydicamycinicus]
MASRTAPESLRWVQDLVNTLDIETGADALSADGGPGAFLRAHGVAEPGAGERELAALQELREALREVCLAHTAGTGVPERTARTLERLFAAAPLVLAVAPDGGTALRPAPGLGGAAQFTARIAAGIATAVADGTWTRLKACEAHDCRWVFYDRSPAGRSRWCTMAVCGSRAKMRTYRARRAESE